MKYRVALIGVSMTVTSTDYTLLSSITLSRNGKAWMKLDVPGDTATNKAELLNEFVALAQARGVLALTDGSSLTFADTRPLEGTSELQYSVQTENLGSGTISLNSRELEFPDKDLTKYQLGTLGLGTLALVAALR